MKIVVNKCYGGFSISKECAQYMANKGSEITKAELEISDNENNWYGYGYSEKFDGYDRTDLLLIEAVETLGDLASGSMAKLRVVEIPDDVDYFIDDYDGIETIHENHRSW